MMTKPSPNTRPTHERCSTDENLNRVVCEQLVPGHRLLTCRMVEVDGDPKVLQVPIFHGLANLFVDGHVSEPPFESGL